MGASEDIKDYFYDELDSLIDKIPKVEPLILLGDFNGRVGSDHQSWPPCIGHHGTGRMNDNGQRLLELCSFHGLCITNTFFQSKHQQKVSWKHPRSHKWHQLDLVIARRSALNNVLATRSYHSADCDTDHAMVCSKVRLSPRKLNRSKPTGRTRINVARTADPQRREQFVGNYYWLKLCESIQNSAECGNVRGMYDGIKKALGPTVRKMAPLKSTSGEMLTDRDKQMERWVEHYSELYSRQTVVTNAALNALRDLPMMEELDNEPTIEDLSKAIDSLSCGKAPGCDSIPPEVIKCAKPALLHQVLCLCWNEGTVPQEMRDATIVTLYKNKGDRSDCNNYRGISLLSIVGKAFARVLLIRLQKLASRVYPESQCGFRAGSSTIDMIFSVRQLQEKCREQ